jgi:iron complex transport system substrate-binding protein
MVSDYTPRRIVSLQPSATVILARLGQLERIVACTRYCSDVCPEILSSNPVIVSDSWTAKADEIIAAQPDLVIAAVPYQEKAVAEILKAKARFLAFAPRTLDDIYGDIATLAALTHTVECGHKVIAGMQQEISSVRTHSENLQRPRVFCEEWGKPLITSQCWVKELTEAAGGEFLGVPGQQVSSNEVREADPEVIVAAWCGAGDRVPLEKIIRERSWNETQAAKKGQVYCIRDEFLNTPAPTLLDGLRALAAAIHPERFPQPAGLRCMVTPVAN